MQVLIVWGEWGMGNGEETLHGTSVHVGSVSELLLVIVGDR